jgi:chromosome segregation ATPase
VPAEAVPELVDLLRRQFEALRADRDRLVDELARLQGELDSAEVRTAALQAEIDRLRRRLAAAPGHFLSAIGRIQQDWNATP